MKTKQQIILVLILFTAIVSAQANDAISKGKQLVEKGYSHFDENLLLQARGIFERVHNADKSNETAAYHLAYCDYRLSVFYMQKKNSEKFDAVSEEADKLCDELLEENLKNAEALSLQGALYGIMISNNWKNSPTLGPKSSSKLSKALEIAPENPRVLLQNGISKYYTPEFYGGSKKKALEFFKEAIKAYKTFIPADSLAPDWGLAETYAWLGIAYSNNKQNKKAREAYTEALKINPDFGWVKYHLLPALVKNEKNQTATEK